MEASKAVETGGIEHLGVSLILKGGGSGGPAVSIRVLGTVVSDDAGDGGSSCGVPKVDHWEAGKLAGQQDLGDTDSRRVPKSGGDEVFGRVHWLTTGDCGTVDGPIPNLGGMYKGNGIQWWRLGAKVVVEADKYIVDTVEHVGGGSPGGETGT